MPQQVRKAVIAAAGSGTRFLPATKAMPKEMLPIVDRPILQYIVEELEASGIKDIIIVIRGGRRAVEDHFDTHPELEKQLAETGKKNRLAEIRRVTRLANFIYVTQKDDMPYGNGTPLLAARDLIGDESFIYCFGDDLVKSRVPATRQLIEAGAAAPEVAGVVAVQKMPDAVLNRYGVAKIKDGTDNVLDAIIEKPEQGEAPSNLASYGRYLFGPKFLEILAELPVGKDNELWLVDAIDKLSRQEKVLVKEIDGQWLTTGDPLNYLKATLEYALDREDLGKELREYLTEKLKA
jgi:UTP--glucose-1-phosphate uridylyltransferase